MKKYLGLILSFTLCITSCWVLAFVLHTWLGDSVFPQSEYYDSYEWADIYLYWYIVFSAAITILNILFVIFHNSKTPQKKWFSMISIDFLISIISFIPIFVIYPLDDPWIYIISICGLSLLTGPGVFFVSTLWAPWDFHPKRIR